MTSQNFPRIIECGTTLVIHWFLKFFKFVFIYFNCQKIALQYCDSCSYTSTWTGHRYTCVPPILNLHPTSVPTSSLQVVTEHWGFYQFKVHSMSHRNSNLKSKLLSFDQNMISRNFNLLFVFLKIIFSPVLFMICHQHATFVWHAVQKGCISLFFFQKRVLIMNFLLGMYWYFV